MAAKTAASKDVTGAAHTETTNDKEQTDDDDDAPTPKHWSSDWDPTLNSLLSVYVQYTAFSLYDIYYSTHSLINVISLWVVYIRHQLKWDNSSNRSSSKVSGIVWCCCTVHNMVNIVL